VAAGPTRVGVDLGALSPFREIRPARCEPDWAVTWSWIAMRPAGRRLLLREPGAPLCFQSGIPEISG